MSGGSLQGWSQGPPSSSLAETPGHSQLWRSLVQFEGGRGAEEIRKFWQNSEHPSINKQEWSEAEVSRLLDIAAQHGHLHWQKIAEELGVSTPCKATSGWEGGRKGPTYWVSPESCPWGDGVCSLCLLVLNGLLFSIPEFKVSVLGRSDSIVARAFALHKANPCSILCS